MRRLPFTGVAARSGTLSQRIRVSNPTRCSVRLGCVIATRDARADDHQPVGYSFEAVRGPAELTRFVSLVGDVAQVTPKKVVSRQARQVVRAQEKMTEFPPEKTIDANTLQCINAIRFLAIDAVEKANSGHPGLPMGCAPMTYVLFNEFMKFNPKNPYFFNRDRFVLSAGHGCMLHYSMLHLTGYDSVKVPPPPIAPTPCNHPASVPAPSRAARSTRSSPCAWMGGLPTPART
jgi:hypothetical protein